MAARLRTWFRPMAPVPKTPILVCRSPMLSSLASAAPAAAARRRFVDSALRPGDEIDQIVGVGISGRLLAHPRQRLLGVEARADQDAEGELEPLHPLGVEPLALEADGIDAVA